MSFSILLVDYHSMETTLEYIDLCNSHMKSSEAVQYIIADNTPEALGLQHLQANCQQKATHEISGYSDYEFSYHNISIHCIPAHENVGYARGNNLAAMVSMTLFPNNHLLVSNNDILFEKDCNLNEIDNLFKIHDYALIGPDVIQFGEHMNPVYRCTPNWYMFVMYLNTVLVRKIRPKIDKSRYCFSGCFWFFNVKYFEKMGGFDDGTFMYFEEQTTEERMRAIGGQLYYYPNMQVVHNHSTKYRNTKADLKYITAFHRSGMYYVRKYLKPNPIKLGLSYICFYLLMIPFVVERLMRDVIHHLRGGNS